MDYIEEYKDPRATTKNVYTDKNNKFKQNTKKNVQIAQRKRLQTNKNRGNKQKIKWQTKTQIYQQLKYVRCSESIIALKSLYQKRSQISDLNFYLKKLEKSKTHTKQAEGRKQRKQKSMKLKTEKERKINETKSSFFEQINKM